MKSVLVIGLGLFGQNLVRKLKELRHQVMAVDVKEERIQAVLPYVTDAQIGDSTDVNFMSSLGVKDYDVCIVAIGDYFQSSVETTMRLKEMGAKLVVARASRDSHEKILRSVGADEIVYPERQLAAWTAVRYSLDHIFDYMALDDDHAMVEVPVPKDWIGRSVGELSVRKKYHVNLMGWKQDRKMHIDIGPETVLHEDMRLMVLGHTKDIQKCFHTSGR